jgi:hypothetical protein
MTTKIFVSQIDKTNNDGSNAADGSYIKLVGGVAVWASASAGATGYVGSIGFNGSIGFRGSAGFQGSVGLKGGMGDSGFEGSAGVLGFQGSVGFSGAGFQGSLGDIGYQGCAGASGIGFQGSLGYPGYQGSLALGGYRGSTGYQGSTSFGFQGSVGFTGSAGASGTPVLAFTGLTDTQTSYTGKSGALVTVKSTTDGLEFVDRSNFLTNPASANLTFNGGVYVSHPVLISYAERGYSSATVTNSIAIQPSTPAINLITLSPSSGSTVAITLPNFTTIFDTVKYNQGNYFAHITVVLYLKQDATGSRTVDWSGNSIKWSTADGIPATGPTLSTTAGYTDIVTFTTMDYGVHWYGFLSAKGFSA